MADSYQFATDPAHWVEQVFSAPGAVLLHAADLSQTTARSLLFADPVRYITATRPSEVEGGLAELQQALTDGAHVAGYLTYEAGLALHGLAAHALPPDEPLLCFGVYRAPQEHTSAPGEPSPSPVTDPLAFAAFPALFRSQYNQNVDRIQQWIAAGDIYQANYTVPLRGLCQDTAQMIYRALLAEQPAPYAAVLRLAPPGLRTPEILSFSPELFFRTDADGTIHTQPMKGTVARSMHREDDAERASWLASDPKNRAEHIMIVDLLRNDLGRICQTGSVKADGIFTVRTLPTVHQMTSDVSGRLHASTPWSEVFRALFPSGSITGAPKRHSMELLQAVENEARGAYTGAIGYIAPTGESCFSVAIRTLTLRTLSTGYEVTCNVGGGIVADSSAPAEYNEAMLKAAFVKRARQPLKVIETMLSEGGKVRWLETHLDRLQRTAEALTLPLDRAQVRERVLAVSRQLPRKAHRVRLWLHESGELEFHTQPLAEWPQQLHVRIAPHRSHLGDPALAHKTTIREAYDQETEATRKAGFDESLFANDAGLITEACLTNVFFAREGQLATPYLECGVLPGILRTQLLRHNLVTESLLPLVDLERCEAVILGNSLRGVYPVHSIELSSGNVIRLNPIRAEPHLKRLRQVFDLERS